MMRGQRSIVLGVTAAMTGTIAFGQVGRGGSQWLTAQGDAQRTSWVRTDDKISVQALSKPGFRLQWKVKLDNPPRGVHGLGQGVTASGVTLFVPMSIVTGGSNNVYGIDNDIGYVVWDRQFDVVMPPPTAACPGGIAAGATRIVSLEGNPGSAPGGSGRRSAAGYRSLLGEPGAGVPVEGRAGGAAARGAGRGAARGTPPAPPQVPGARSGQAADRIPGSPRVEEGSTGAFGFLSRPSGVAYVISSDGMLHVLGLQSGKDLQKPAPFLPPNSKWSSPIAVGTMLYAATSSQCGGAPDGVWAIDLDSEAKTVTSWKTNGGSIVGAVAFASGGTLYAAVGPGRTTGDGKANAIVALDPKTLQLQDWFTQPDAAFATGPTILKHHDREIVAAATNDGRVFLLDATSLGGKDHATPMHASKAWLAAGASLSADAIATWQDSRSWILLPAGGRLASGVALTHGAVNNGAVVALKIVDAGTALSLEPGWVSHDLAAPATPMTVNGVVFALATGVPAKGAGGTPSVLHAYEGATGKRLWNSGKSMTTFASPGSVWTGLGQIYVGAHDGTLHAFGFSDERWPAFDR